MGLWGTQALQCCSRALGRSKGVDLEPRSQQKAQSEDLTAVGILGKPLGTLPWDSLCSLGNSLPGILAMGEG